MLLSLRGHELFIERAGTGRPLVLLHGLGTPSVWDRVAAPLALSFDVIRVHLPGFGSSPPALLSTSDHASLIADLITELRLDSCVVCGLSYGGQVAATLAAAGHDRIGALVLAAPSGLMRRYRLLRSDLAFDTVRALARATVLRDASSVRRWNGRLYADAANQPEAIVEEFLRMIADDRRAACWFGCLRSAAVPEGRFADRLRSIAVPTLLVWGDRDRVVPPSLARRFLDRIPGSRLRVLERCGHALPLERPAELVTLLRELALPRG